MAKTELKTKPRKQSVTAFLNGIDHDTRRRDAKLVDKMMQEAVGQKGVMWGTSIVGYGSYHYVYESGREGDWMLTGFSPRKVNLVLYIMPGFDRHEKLLARLGKHRTGKSCLYINKLDDVNIQVLEELVAESVKAMRKKHDSA